MKILTLLKSLFNLKATVSNLVAQVDSLSPSPRPRNRSERRLLARKGHL